MADIPAGIRGIDLSPYATSEVGVGDFGGNLLAAGQVPFLARVSIGDNDKSALVPASFNLQTGGVHIFAPDSNGIWRDGRVFDLHDLDQQDAALFLLTNVVQTPPDLDLMQHDGKIDPRPPVLKTIERALSAQLPFNLQEATDRLLNEQSNGNEDLSLYLRQTLYGFIYARAKKLESAEEPENLHKAQQARQKMLDRAEKLYDAGKADEASDIEARAENVIQTTEAILARLDQRDPDISDSLRALSLGNPNRLRQLVAEYMVVTSSELQEKKAQVTRAVAEHQLLYERGVPKAMYVASFYDKVDDPAEILTDEELKKAAEKYSPQFAGVSQRYAAATKLANHGLEKEGEHAFSLKSYRVAELMQDHAQEAQDAEKKGLITTDYSSLTLENGVLTDRGVETIEGMPLSWWYDLPITPLLMKKDFLDPDSEEAREMSESAVTAENIMRVMESNQITNHGAHVDISPKMRDEIVSQMQQAVAAERPIQFELYYSVGAMANPLERNQASPSLQDWAMWYKYGQISETIGLFYQPKDNQPPVQWVIIDETQAFGDVWDLDPVKTREFRTKVEEMVAQMGLSNTILFDELQRMADEGGQDVQESIAQEYMRIAGKWSEFTKNIPSIANRSEGISQALEDKIAQLKNAPKHSPQAAELRELKMIRKKHDRYLYLWDFANQDIQAKDYKDIKQILDREVSMMRLVNPLRVDGPIGWDERTPGYPDMTIDELLHVYNGIMPHVHFDGFELTAREQEILAVVQARGLHANIYSSAVMNSRHHMQRRYSNAIKVTITDKDEKMVVVTGDDRAQVFPGHGVPVFLSTNSSSLGSPEPGNPWLNVDRLVGQFTDRADLGIKRSDGTIIRAGEPRGRFIGVVDPESREITHYIENPTLMYTAEELDIAV